MAANAGETKVKLWEGICYPENMRSDWQEEIDDILQVPFAYAIHDIDRDQKSKRRKTHVHVIVVWNGNTTRNAIINVLNRLSAEGKSVVLLLNRLTALGMLTTISFTIQRLAERREKSFIQLKLVLKATILT